MVSLLGRLGGDKPAKNDKSKAQPPDGQKKRKESDAMRELKAKMEARQAGGVKAVEVDEAGRSVVTDYGTPSLKRKATRREVGQAKKVRKAEEKRAAVKEQNRKRYVAGKKLKDDPSMMKPTIWERMAEPRLYAMLREMGDATKAIDKYQRKRVIMTIIVFMVGIFLGLIIHPWLYILAPVLGFFFYKMQFKRVQNFHRAWKFQRQLNFSKFTRLVIPYLKAAGGGTALYTIFTKILKRTDDPDDRRSIYKLMGEMGDNPQDITPFLNFAERSSGTDMSHLFMSTIFDFQQSTFDVSVIDELGQMASEDMMNSIDEIIEMKLRRFNMFPTKVVMSSFILVAGLGVGMMLHNFKDLGFSGDVAQFDPNAAAEETNANMPSEAPIDGESDGEGPGGDVRDADALAPEGEHLTDEELSIDFGDPSITLDATLLFEANSTELRDVGEEAFDEVVDELESASGDELLIVGHTDNTESEDYSQELSEDRALAVYERLDDIMDLEQFDKIRAEGRNFEEPVAPNDTEENQALNRRVELYFEE